MPELQHYQGREQGYVKHVLIEKYLQRFAIIIAKKWDEIVYLDAFAGPWGTRAEDLSDTSFGIALKCLRNGIKVAAKTHEKAIKTRVFLIEKEKEPFLRLEEFANSQQKPGFAISSYHGSFEEKITEVRQTLEQNKNQRFFLFALIDPKGWTGLSMELIAPLVNRRSCEVLVNVMSSFIRRFVDAEGCQDSYERFFGRSGVREIIRMTPKPERHDALVREYCRSLRHFCGFRHVSSCVVLEPNKQDVKYFMVFATNDPMGIKVFKEAEAHAASIQDDIKDAKKQQGQGFLDLGMDSPTSAMLREKYRNTAFQRVIEHLQSHPVSAYADVFCKALAMPLVTEDELRDFLKNHPMIEVTLDGPRRKKPNIQNKDIVHWKGWS